MITNCRLQIAKRQKDCRAREARAGFTLIEIVISMGIVMIVGVLFMRLSQDITSSALRFTNSLVTQQAIQVTLQGMVPEIRSASQSNDGAYAVSIAATSTFEFYTDIDRNGTFDRVRYFLNGTTFQKGIVRPSGNPLAYVSSTETVQPLIDNVIAGSQIFSYYDKSATSSSSTALPSPVDPVQVKTVKITLIANQGTSSTPSIVGVETEATIRNLRYK